MMGERAIDRWRHAIRTSDLPPTYRHVALELAEFMNYDTLCNAHPGTKRLADRTGFHVRTVQNALKRLEEAGWIVRVWQGGNRHDERRAYGRGEGGYLRRRERSASMYCGRFPTGKGGAGLTEGVAQD